MYVRQRSSSREVALSVSAKCRQLTVQVEQDAWLLVRLGFGRGTSVAFRFRRRADASLFALSLISKVSVGKNQVRRPTDVPPRP